MGRTNKTYKPPSRERRTKTSERQSKSYLSPRERVHQKEEEKNKKTEAVVSAKSAKDDTVFQFEEQPSDSVATFSEGDDTFHASTLGQSTFTATTDYKLATDVKSPSPKHRQNLSNWYARKYPMHKMQSYLSSSVSKDDETLLDNDSLKSLSLDATMSEDPQSYLRTKQEFAYLSVLLSAGQLLVLMLQLALCGVAPFEINPLLGPFPDTFNDWGAKNAYSILADDEWWRLITPTFLHAGVFHLIANAFCTLTTLSLFEREWGSARWLFIYIASAANAVIYSCYFDSDTIAITSSGTLMGLYAAKLAQVFAHTFFQMRHSSMDDILPLNQLGNVLCGLILVSATSVFKYTDWSGHCGSLACGFTAGMVLFGGNIRSVCFRIFWVLLGLAGMSFSTAFVLYDLIENTQPDPELSDACDFFSAMYPEDYVCGCMEE